MADETSEASEQAFLDFLAKPVAEHPELVEPLDARLLAPIAVLVEDLPPCTADGQVDADRGGPPSSARCIMASSSSGSLWLRA